MLNKRVIVERKRQLLKDRLNNAGIGPEQPKIALKNVILASGN